MYRCYNCGFETEDKGQFVNNQGDGDHTWMMFSCPQCLHSNPPVAPPSRFPWPPEPPYAEPKWTVKISEEAVRICCYGPKNSRFLAPIIPQHQIANLPAKKLDPYAPEGMTIFQYSNMLSKEYWKRLEEFSKEDKILRAQFGNTEEELNRYREASEKLHLASKAKARKEVEYKPRNDSIHGWMFFDQTRYADAGCLGHCEGCPTGKQDQCQAR